MAGELHEISRAIGSIESKIETILSNQHANSERFAAIETRLEPVKQLVDDHKDLKATVGKHEVLVNKGVGFIGAVGMLAGSFGFMIHQFVVWGLRKAGFSF